VVEEVSELTTIELLEVLQYQMRKKIYNNKTRTIFLELRKRIISEKMIEVLEELEKRLQ